MTRGASSFFPTLSMQQLGTFFDVIEDSLAIHCHQDLLHWLHDDVQAFIPHEIMVAAWGDFCLGLVHLDIVSYLPGLRTTDVDQQDLLPFLFKTFEQWMNSERRPFPIQLNEGALDFSSSHEESDFGKTIRHMRSALVQGIKDHRGRHDCLYVVFSTEPHFDDKAMRSMDVLLPYIDAALRQVSHLPGQYPEKVKHDAVIDSSIILAPGNEEHGLSLREVEIMRWVCMGKTNLEVGMILDISSFTVKNHLQRIFRKLQVINRAQAVAKMERAGFNGNG